MAKTTKKDVPVLDRQAQTRTKGKAARTDKTITNLKYGNKNNTNRTTNFKNFRNKQQANNKKPDNKKKVQKSPFSLQKQAEYAAKAEAKAIRIKHQKAKRLEKTIIISKKTRRGQPLMKDRINYLLTKIQESKK